MQLAAIGGYGYASHCAASHCPQSGPRRVALDLPLKYYKELPAFRSRLYPGRFSTATLALIGAINAQGRLRDRQRYIVAVNPILLGP